MHHSQTGLTVVRDVLSALLHGTIAGLSPPWTLAFIESRWGRSECFESRGAADELVFSRLHCSVWRRDGLVEHANLATWLSSNELAAATVLEAVSPTDRAWIASMLRGPEVFAKQSLISGIARYRDGEERVEAVGPLEGFVVVEPVDDHEAGAAFVAILAVCDPAQRQTVRCAAARALRWPARSVLPSAAAPPGQTRSSARRAATDPILNHYRDGDRSFLGARQCFDLISTALVRSGHLRCPSRARYRPSRLSASLTTMPFAEQRHCPSEMQLRKKWRICR